MTRWADLPTEVKHVIFSMIVEVDSIIYVPRDRRRKIDRRYARAHHFHDLLLVSKDFISPDEFAIAILGSAKLKFRSYNEIRRLITEVSMCFKESIRRIHLSRATPPTFDFSSLHERNIAKYRLRGPDTDTFTNFCNVGNTLSTAMPNLRQITISCPGYCTHIARFKLPLGPQDVSEDDVYPGFIDHVLSDGVQGNLLTAQVVHTNSLHHVAASFVGNRFLRVDPYCWTRPIPWIRRLVVDAEDRDVEIVFQIDLCFANVVVHLLSRDFILIGEKTSGCWSTRHMSMETAASRVHLQSEMSTKDYMLKVEYHGCKYTFHQKLAYDLLHAPASQSQEAWLDLVEDVKLFDEKTMDGF